MSPRRYRISSQALTDLEEIAKYLAERSPHAAHAILDTLEQTIRSLAREPGLGERRDDLCQGIHIFVPVKPAHRYVIFYYIANDAVEFSDIIHSARDWTGLFARAERGRQ